MQPVSSDSMHKISEIDLKVVAQFYPLFFFKEIFFSHLCQGKCSDTRCGEPPAMNNQNARYNINIGAQKRFY